MPPEIMAEQKPVAQKAAENVSRQADAAWEKNLQHVQRDFQKIVDKLQVKLAADGTSVSIVAGLEGEPVILVTDRYTGEVIRQIPPEELRDLAEDLEFLRGVFFNRTG
jgi:flagellar protein FlaG